MTGKKMDGGPAFPHKERVRDTAAYPGAEYFDRYHDGMTLRDYFAADAPIKLGDAIAVEYQANIPHMSDAEILQVFATLARLRYQYADAMLEERAK